ncbi:MAG: hypothetical protein WDO16_12720 [Bacteroidota bacterium]
MSLSESKKSIEDIWSWYEDQKEGLRYLKNSVITAILNSSAVVNPKFITLTSDEINDYFDYSEEELEHLVCFDLISATEGALRSDFYSKVFNKDKSNLGRTFRQLHKEKGNKISLEADIIENWKDAYTASKIHFSNLLGLLKYRHWLAHGRYWDLTKKGRRFYVQETYDITEEIIDLIE